MDFPKFDLPIQMVAQVPVRVKTPGTITIGAGATVTFSGTDNKQTRIAFVVTNLDAQNSVKIQTNPGGQNWGTAFARGYYAVSFSGDFQIYNPNGAGVSVEVAEFYPDTGNLHTPYAVLGVPKTSEVLAGGGAPPAPNPGGSVAPPPTPGGAITLRQGGGGGTHPR